MVKKNHDFFPQYLTSLYLSAGSDKNHAGDSTDGQPICLILISQKGYDARTRKNILIFYYYHFGNHGNRN